MNDYYVYVYIDPRNHEEFYYGKGKGSRKSAHLKSQADTEKTKRITAISRAGLSPIIRVVARGLTENEALLVEKTYLHKLGKTLTNVSSGYYADRFRPHDTLHIELPGFDYKFGVYYFNIGQGPHRQWADCRKHGFISAGQGARWARAIKGFNPGDIFAAYLKKKGFVGIGRITEKARPIREVTVNGLSLLNLSLQCQKMGANIDNNKTCEYVALVEWIKSVPEKDAKFRSGIYTTTHVRASLDNQPVTRSYLEEEFNVSFRQLAG